MDERADNLLEDVVQDIAENAAAAQTVLPVVHEPLMVRIERDRARRKRANAIMFTTLVGFALALAGVTIASLLDSAPSVATSDGGVSITLGAGCPGPLVPLAFGVLIVGVLVLYLRPPNVAAAMRLFSARPAGAGEVSSAKEALASMSLAVGLPKPPPLYVIDTDSVNAFSVGKTVDACAMGITRGMAGMLSTDELRAVFAHLLARVVIGNAARSELDEALPVQADAEAMYLLRDPRAMLSALERVLGSDTTVTTTGAGVVTALFFAPWMQLPGVLEPLSAVVNADVEDRVERLRAILGADGAVG